MQSMTFDIHGMTCGGCVGGVQRTLQKIDGVSDIQVSLHSEKTILKVDPLHVSALQIEVTIAKLGYQANFRPSAIDGQVAS
ncbi:heavy-metal-associated domain-containing protein [Polaromonas naphthalenivorans]|jgi:copper chaperone|uniref:Heavy metal transport/detoxification protein n=1 Tax=Polaromonas naphthalenivorans (strain CJ2) TaxID=365044 RepID=A1VVW7_POLNA|nr:heavy metal-associated domain-containing protein [Polaromonas naphthalenivorans]ABM39795.1 Heavy metal transport/detoxification protein [Polaromonas naphthalenivorans CJ2]